MASCGSTQNWGITIGPEGNSEWYDMGQLPRDGDVEQIYRPTKVAIGGVFTQAPTEMLTVSAHISATGVLYTSAGVSYDWQSTYATMTANSAGWEATEFELDLKQPRWDTVYTLLTGYSADWQSTYATMTANSGSGTHNTILKWDSSGQQPIDSTITDDGTTVTVTGNFKVDGTTTTIDTANLTVEDKLIRLNKGGAEFTTRGAGIEVEENNDSAANAYIKIEDAANPTAWAIKASDGKEVKLLCTGKDSTISVFDDFIIGENTSDHVAINQDCRTSGVPTFAGGYIGDLSFAPATENRLITTTSGNLQLAGYTDIIDFVSDTGTTPVTLQFTNQLSKISIKDNVEESFKFVEGSTDYVQFNTLDGLEHVKVTKLLTASQNISCNQWLATDHLIVSGGTVSDSTDTKIYGELSLTDGLCAMGIRAGKAVRVFGNTYLGNSSNDRIETQVGYLDFKNHTLGVGGTRIDIVEYNNSLTFGTQNITSILSLDGTTGSGGMVGINTQAPSERLHVWGNIRAVGTLSAEYANATNWFAGPVLVDGNHTTLIPSISCTIGGSISARDHIYSTHAYLSGNLDVHGNTELGDATTDSFIINPDVITLPTTTTFDCAGDIILDADGGDIILKDDGTEAGRITLDQNAPYGAAPNILIDSVGDITLDAAGNNVYFAANGTSILNIAHMGGNTIIAPLVEDKDIMFHTYGGSSVFTLDSSAASLLIDSTKKIEFRDTGLYIHSSADGQLDIDADTTLELTAPTVDINTSTEFNIDTVLYDLNATGNINMTGVIFNLDASGAIDIDGATTVNIAANGTSITLDAATDIVLDAEGLVDIDGKTTVNIAAETTTITLDAKTDIILDAEGKNLYFAVAGTNKLNIEDISDDIIFQPIIEHKDIIFKEDGGNEIARFDSSAESLLMAAGNKIEFRDTNIYIHSSADGKLDIDADAEVEIVAPSVDIDATGGVNISHNLYVGGDLHIDGTTTRIDSTVMTIQDPVITLGLINNAAPSSDDNKDRGIEFNWHDGTANVTAGSFVTDVEYTIISTGNTDFTAIGAANSNIGTVFTATGAGTGTGTANATANSKIGFFGHDDSKGRFVFIPQATNTSEVFSGDLGDIEVAGGLLGNIQVGITSDNEIDTTSGSLTIDSAGGTITLDDHVSITGNTTIGDAEADTITFNAAAWTTAYATNVTLGGTLNFDSNTFVIDKTNNRVGIGIAAPLAPLHVMTTANQLRLGYDASNFSEIYTDMYGNLLISPKTNQHVSFISHDVHLRKIVSQDSSGVDINVGTGVGDRLFVYSNTTSNSAAFIVDGMSRTASINCAPSAYIGFQIRGKQDFDDDNSQKFTGYATCLRLMTTPGWPIEDEYSEIHPYIQNQDQSKAASILHHVHDHGKTTYTGTTSSGSALENFGQNGTLGWGTTGVCYMSGGILGFSQWLHMGDSMVLADDPPQPTEGGILYTKTTGKLYFKSNAIATALNLTLRGMNKNEGVSESGDDSGLDTITKVSNAGGFAKTSGSINARHSGSFAHGITDFSGTIDPYDRQGREYPTIAACNAGGVAWGSASSFTGHIIASGGFAHGHSYGFSTVKAQNNGSVVFGSARGKRAQDDQSQYFTNIGTLCAKAVGSFAGGYVGNSRVLARKTGSFAWGSATGNYAKMDGPYASSIEANGYGSVAIGQVKEYTQYGSGEYSKGYDAKLHANADGSVVFGKAHVTVTSQTEFGLVKDAIISTDSDSIGAFACGYAKADKQHGKIQSTAPGAFAMGMAHNAFIASNGNGSFAGGYALGYVAAGSHFGSSSIANSFKIVAGGSGAFAFGSARNAYIQAAKPGAVAMGYGNGADIAAGGYGAGAFGYAKNTKIQALGDNTFQFGEGGNYVTDSFSCGQYFRFRHKHHTTHPSAGSLRNGDFWIKDNKVFVKSDGSNLQIGGAVESDDFQVTMLSRIFDNR